MGIPDHFSARAAGYAAFRPSYPTALVDYLAEVAPRRELAWDAGCGSGQLSIPLAAQFDRVIATDSSAGQIAAARPHGRVEYRCAPAESSGLPDAVADLAVSAQAAHWFDLDGYYAEVRRVARRDAVVALVTYGLTTIDNEIDALVDHFYSEVLGSYWAAERSHVEDGYRSLPFPFAEMPTPVFEIRADLRCDALIGYVETWSAVRALEAAGERARFDEFVRHLVEAWAVGPATRVVRWPVSVRAGRVRA